MKYFANRIVHDIDGYIDDVMQPCEFNEKADIGQTMRIVIKMSSMIQSYVGTLSKDTEVKLHVDMTGGMRHASLMMLVITRRIQYSGVKIGYILYSNFDRDRAEQFVEESNEIYNLFDLIVGAEEFVRFGSVDAIQSYFSGRNIPKVLQKLLDAMNKFAQAIKISRRMEFQEALQGLQAAYKKFGAESEKFSTINDIPALNYNLVKQLKIRIMQEYAALLERSVDDYVSIIDWCLDHGYIQQALVLYTEAFPYLIVAKYKLLTASPAINDELDKYTDKRRYETRKRIFADK